MDSKLLKQYKGFTIEKSWDTNANGSVKKDSIIYAAYDLDGDLFNACSNLPKLKKDINKYVN